MSFMELFSRYVAYPAWNFKDGSQKLGEYRRLNKSQWYSPEDMEGYQLDRLQKIMVHAFSTVPYYRGRWKRNPIENPLRSLADLEDFPILTKQDVRQNLDELISSSFDKSELVTAKTGGSTGVALELYFDKQCQEFRNAAAMMADGWAAWRPGMLVAGLWGTPPVPRTFKEKVRNALHDRAFYLDTMDLNPHSMSEFLEKMSSSKAKALFGHAHSLFLLAKFVEANDLPVPRLCSIVSTSMMLLPSQREVIERAFGTRVTNRYGCEEVGLVACECEKHMGLHINAEHIVVELLGDDGKPVAMGNQGRLVLTDLNNRGMPMVRYEVGDLAELSGDHCDCGRGYPSLSCIVGRTADYLLRSDGSNVSGISLVEKTLTAIVGIEQLQIVQEELRRFVLKVVPDEYYSSKAEDELVNVIRDVFGAEVAVHVETVEKLSQSENGKYRFAISNI